MARACTRAAVAPTMEWLAEEFLVLLADPIVYTLDEGALSRHERGVLVR